MMLEAPLIHFDTPEAQDEALAAWVAWLSRGPITEDLTRLIEQLDADHFETSEGVLEPAEV